MLRISLYQNFCVCLCVISINTYDYRKNQSCKLTDKQRLQLEEGFRNGRISYALSNSPVEITGSDLKGDRIANGHDPYLRQLLGETLRDRGYLRIGNTPEAWPQTNNGLLGRGSSLQSHRTRQRVMKAKEAWQKTSGKEAGANTFMAFLSALARDIDV